MVGSMDRRPFSDHMASLFHWWLGLLHFGAKLEVTSVKGHVNVTK